MLEGLEHIRWDQEVQPSWNTPDEVPQALRALAAATPETGDAVYSRVLYALGNNHAGTYFPVVLAVVPFLGELLREGSATTRIQTLEILIDLIASFDPDPDFEFIGTPTGPQPLKLLLWNHVARLEADVERCLAKAASPEEARPAGEVLSRLREENVR
ncbi:hypothetical protein [Corallococcus terminator]|uniref:HEAT repeat domain-containing protein n=1 Tax=Corallococcus terminator TaxID=2316733 RepID=A0A3A8JSY7_9BACT|nr:hypothetical protein [Corallococcus terminator]RKG92733.1 hypothetical protein D7V88_05095 [Corallococcus terminator]